MMLNDEICVITWDTLYEETQNDLLMLQLIEMIHRGSPDRSFDVPDSLKPYYRFRQDLHVVAGVVCYKDRVGIPPKLRQQVLDTIHAAN